jgi:hypothetical protein
MKPVRGSFVGTVSGRTETQLTIMNVVALGGLQQLNQKMEEKKAR